MTRRKVPCFVGMDDVLVASGLQPDRHGLKQALWEAAENVIFAQGRVVRKKSPALTFSTLDAPVRGIGQQHASDGGRWLWAGVDKHIYRWEFGSPELVAAAYGSYRGVQAGALLPTFYDFTPYGNWMIVNDGVAPFIHKPELGAGAWAAWAGQVPQAAVRYMKVLNFILALGYDLRGTRVGWSDADNIDTWTAAPDNLAGSLTIDEFNTPIRAAERLGSYVACYGEDQMGLISFIGQPNIFGQKLSLDGIGAVGKAAVASDLKQNVGVSRNGVWWTDGNSYEYIDRGFLADHLQEAVNWAQAGMIVAAKNEATNCFEFHFPVGSAVTPNEAWSWDQKSRGWSPIPPASFKSARSLFNNSVLGGGDGSVSFDDFDYSNGDDLPLLLRTKPLTLQAPDGTTLGTHITSYIDELELLLLEASGIEVRVGSADDPNGDWEWTEWLGAEAGSRIIPLPRLPENPLWKVEFRSVPGVTDWRLNLQGLLLYGPPTGTKLEL